MAEFTYFHGDKAEYTGKTHDAHGLIYYEIKMVEGHRIGELLCTPKKPHGTNFQQHEEALREDRSRQVPKELHDQAMNNPIVSYCMSMYFCGRVDYQTMLEKLAIALSQKNNQLVNDLVDSKRREAPKSFFKSPE